jgi:hypothetical protein
MQVYITVVCDLQSLSTSDWVNAVAQSTLAGELTVIFSHQLLIAVDTEKGMRDKRMVCMLCYLLTEESYFGCIRRGKAFRCYVTVLLVGIDFSAA